MDKEKITIEKAFKIRRELISGKYKHEEVKVLESIMYGHYDRCKGEAKDDMEFLQKNRIRSAALSQGEE